MLVAITNTSNHQVLLRFNSGVTRRLAPSETLEGVQPAAVNGNRRIKRLQERRVIAITASDATTPTERRRSVRSRDMTAAEAVDHIKTAPIAALREFLSPDEDRATVLKAMKERREP